MNLDAKAMGQLAAIIVEFIVRLYMGIETKEEENTNQIIQDKVSGHWIKLRSPTDCGIYGTWSNMDEYEYREFHESRVTEDKRNWREQDNDILQTPKEIQLSKELEKLEHEQRGIR